jgi:hypothetical protein
MFIKPTIVATSYVNDIYDFFVIKYQQNKIGVYGNPIKCALTYIKSRDLMRLVSLYHT